MRTGIHKKLLPFITALLLLLPANTSADNYIYVPDDNFEQGLIDLGYDDVLDDYVLTDNIDDVTSLNLQNRGISDATGLEDFTSVTSINFFSNNLTTLDLSGNPALTSLEFGFSNLTTLDLSNNPSLTFLAGAHNDLESIDLSGVPNLGFLGLQNNNLTELDLSNNPGIGELFVNNNNLTSLDLSNQHSLSQMFAEYNNLTSLTFGSSNVYHIRAYGNQLDHLDVSMLPNVKHLRVSNNGLTSLNMRNGVTTVLIDLQATGNSLSCIETTDPDYFTDRLENGSGLYFANGSLPTITNSLIWGNNTDYEGTAVQEAFSGGSINGITFINSILEDYSTGTSYWQNMNAQAYEFQQVSVSDICYTVTPFVDEVDPQLIFTNDDDLAEIAKEIRTHGQEKRYYHSKIGVNGRLDTIQAAILLVKMKIFEREIELRKEVGNRYSSLFSQYCPEEVITPYIHPKNNSVYAQYTIQVSNRKKLIERLSEYKIPTAVHYPMALNKQPAFLTEEFDVEISTKVSEKVVSSPMHPYLSETDQQKVVKKCTDIIKGKYK